MNRKQRRALKREVGEDTANRVEAVEKAISSIPKSCGTCSQSFDKNNKEMLDRWMINIDEKGFQLTCPKCLEDKE